MKNPNNFGSCYKLNGNRRKPWIARITVGWEGTKQLYQTIGYFETKKEGIDALVMNRIDPIAPKANITLLELYTEWSDIKYKKASPTSIYGYKAAWNSLKKYEKVKFKELRTTHIQDVINILEDEGKSKSTMNMIKVLCKALYDYAMQNDIVNKNYAAFAKLPSSSDVKKERFTDLEIKKLEELATTVPFADTILIMIYTGMRISEMLELTKFNINIKDMVITGGIKTDAGKDRTIPIHPKIQKYILDWYNKNGSTLIFKDGTKKNITPEYYRLYIYYPLLEYNGIRRLTPHACRHTFASLMARAGVDTVYIQQLMGHVDYATTANIYTHVEIAELKKAIENI